MAAEVFSSLRSQLWKPADNMNQRKQRADHHVAENHVEEQLLVGPAWAGARFPAGGFEQPDGGGVDVEAPRREKADVAPALNRRSRGRTHFEDQRFQAALKQVCRRGQSHGSGADHSNGKRLRCTLMVSLFLIRVGSGRG
jgi:hypothetical protein